MVKLASTALLAGSLAQAAIVDDTVQLPEPRRQSATAVERALAHRRSVRSFAETSLSLAEVGQLLWAAQGITHPDGLRTAPSAGARYPLELYLIAGQVADLQPGLYRYSPAAHALTLEMEGDKRADIARSAFRQTWVQDAPAIILVAAVFTRTRLKYGKRGVRYVHMEAGHVGQNIALQAVALGLGSTVVGSFDDARISAVAGLRREEQPLSLIPVGRKATK